jgi:hypothetical protein
MAQEINTGIFFPSALSQDSHLKLVGVGVRRKLVFHVYAFGLYLNTKDLSKKLKSQYGSTSSDQLAGDGKFWDAVVSDEQDQAIVLVMYRKISGDLLNEAFNVSLMERIKKIGLTEASSKADKGTNSPKQKDEVEPLVALENFKKLFSDRNLSRNTKLTFHWQKGGSLVVSIDSEQVGKIVSPILCSALFDIYLGGHPIDAKAKSAIASSLQTIFNHPNKEDRDTIDKKEEEAVQKADKKSRLPRKLAVLRSKL